MGFAFVIPKANLSLITRTIPAKELFAKQRKIYIQYFDVLQELTIIKELRSAQMMRCRLRKFLKNNSYYRIKQAGHENFLVLLVFLKT